MNELFIWCRLKDGATDAELQQITIDWFDENIPDLDYSCVFDIDGYMENGKHFNTEGCVSIGDTVFYNDGSCDVLEEYTKEYDLEFLKNMIRCQEYYILLCELSEEELAKIGIISFSGEDGSQFGYNRTLENAKEDLEDYLQQLKDLEKDE